MPRILPALVAILVLAFAAAPRAQGLGDGDRQAIVAVIQSQLDAFQRDDGGAAFSYASPAIQNMFTTPDIFMEMVRRGYAPVYRPQRYEFQGLDTTAGNPIQDVLMIGPDGEPVIARYTMQQQPDGSWRIHGCTLTRPDGLSV